MNDKTMVNDLFCCVISYRHPTSKLPYWAGLDFSFFLEANSYPFSDIVKNKDNLFPIEDHVEVYSVLFSVSAVTPDEGNFIYPVIGPYTSGLIETFDPDVEADRKKARRFSTGAWDITLRIEQGGKTKTFMIPLAWDEDGDPLNIDSFLTHAVNVPTRDGQVTKAKVLLTPEVTINGLPENPRILFSVENPVVEPSNPTGIFHFNNPKT